MHDASLMHKTHVRDFEAILDTLSNLTLSILDAVKPGTSASGYSRLLTSEKENEKREVKRRKQRRRKESKRGGRKRRRKWKECITLPAVIIVLLGITAVT